MSLLIHDDHARVAEWVGTNLQKPISAPYTAIGWQNERGELVAGAVFNDFNGSNIEVTIYGPGHMTPDKLRAGFRYVFGQLKCNRLSATTERRNKPMLRLYQRLGFTFEAVRPQYYGPHKRNDGILYVITPERAARWMQ